MVQHADIDHTGIPGVGGAGLIELDYVQFTSSVSLTATTEGTANTIVTGNSVAYDGSQVVLIAMDFELQLPGSGNSIFIILLDGGTVLGQFVQTQPSSGTSRIPFHRELRTTPTAASHTYTVKGFVNAGTGTALVATGGTGNRVPGFMRITAS